MTARVVLKVLSGHVRIRQHMRDMSGKLYQDAGGSPIILQAGHEHEFSPITGSNGHKSFLVIEEGDGELKFLQPSDGD